MQRIVYLISYPLLWIISKLPFWLFYRVSDVVFFLLFYIIGYRKNVVLDNLKLAFPEKNDSELIEIRKKFYKHMCDVFLEMIKMLSISEKEHEKRFVFTNPEVIQEIEKTQSIMLMSSHYANWEWPIILGKQIKSKGYAVYRNIKNIHFDNLIKKIRGRYGAELIKMNMISRKVVGNEQKNIRSTYVMVGDQSPFVKSIRHWAYFMGIEVPFHNGAENLARKLDLAMVYMKVEKIKRGHYQATFVPITTSATNYSNFELTDLYIKEVEKQIRQQPEYYLWTHKRWKHRHLAPSAKKKV